MKYLKNIVIFCSFCAISIAGVYPMENRMVNRYEEEEKTMPTSESEVLREIAEQVAPLLHQGIKCTSKFFRDIVYRYIMMKNESINGAYSEDVSSFVKYFFSALGEFSDEMHAQDR